MKKYIINGVLGLVFLMGGLAVYGQQPIATPTPSDADVDLMQRGQMVNEIKMLRATNEGLKTQVTELKSQVATYDKLNAVQEARISDLKESIADRTQAGTIDAKIEDLYKTRITEYQTENQRLRTENESLRKSRDKRTFIAGAIGVALGHLLF